MSFFAHPTDPPRPKTKNIRPISLFFAGILTVMIVTQLFTFEKFPDVIVSLELPGSGEFSLVYAAVIVTLEVLALPFLLSLRVSRLMRIVSMVAGWLAITTWLKIALWENLVLSSAENSGLFGATIALPAGWWMVLFSLALAVLAGWSAWGMWPLAQHKSK